MKAAVKVWCAWCGDDIEPHSGLFCDAECEREFWHDVYNEADQEDWSITRNEVSKAN